MFVIDFETD